MRSFFSRLAMLDEDKLTAREERLVQYVQNNLQHIVKNEMKIERLAQEAGTGYSAIYSLLTKLNLRGYRDFIMALSDDAINIENDLVQNDEQVTSSLINLIKQNYTITDRKEIHQTLTLIHQSERVFLVAWEPSLLEVVQELENFLVLHSQNVYFLFNQFSMIENRIRNTKKGDLFIFYTFYSNNDLLVRLIKKIKTNQANIVLISSRLADPNISKYVDSIHTLITTANHLEKEKLYISKTIPFLYFNDLLIYHYTNSKRYK